MTHALIHDADVSDPWLLDEDAWDAPRRLTDADLFTHGSDGWRRAGFDVDDPEDFR